MPLFSSSTPFDGDVEKATSEMNTNEDWGVIMDICDKVGRTPNGAKDCLKSIVKRLNHRIPHVSMQAVTLLDACSNNCGRAFHLEIASRDFVSECRTLIGGKAHPKVSSQLKQLIKKWAENDFKSDPALDMIPTLYNGMQKDGIDFAALAEPAKTAPVPKDPNVVSSQQEEDDIAKAIALSLEEEEKKKGGKGASIYPTFTAPSTSSASPPPSKSKELRKVRALYDFEAAEDNELTFKAGEVISILDDSDANWWKGSTWRGEGLFPANFCTADLSVEIEPEGPKEKKSVQFNEEVEVKEVEPVAEAAEIDEDKIDKCLTLLQNADPTGETTPDPPELLALEEQCKSMGPLIDTELEKIDRKHNDLMDLNSKVMDALQMYHNLMKELPAYGYGGLPKMMPAQQQGTPQPQAFMQHPGMVYNGQPPASVPQPAMPQPPIAQAAMTQAPMTQAPMTQAPMTQAPMASQPAAAAGMSQPPLSQPPPLSQQPPQSFPPAAQGAPQTTPAPMQYSGVPPTTAVTNGGGGGGFPPSTFSAPPPDASLPPPQQQQPIYSQAPLPQQPLL